MEAIVNNLSLNMVEPLGADLNDFRRVIDANLRVTIQCTQALLPEMRERGYGRIVNLSNRGALGRTATASTRSATARPTR